MKFDFDVSGQNFGDVKMKNIDILIRVNFEITKGLNSKILNFNFF